MTPSPRATILVFLAALALRLGHVGETFRSPFLLMPQQDHAASHAWAHRIAPRLPRPGR